jgi:dihydrofolate reductase
MSANELEASTMASIRALITTSVDGYITAPDDGPGKGLGAGGERLHYWVFGGPWTYEQATRPQSGGVEGERFARFAADLGAVVGGRATYEAARHWGGKSPGGVPFFVVTHRADERPDGEDFTFVAGVREAVARAAEAAGEKDVHIMGGADVIRQALSAGIVDVLTLIVAPFILGAGKRLFEGFSRSLELEQLGVEQARWATFLDYRVMGS